MSLLIAALIGFLAWGLWREPGGRLWRMLVEAPARQLNQLTWRHVAIVIVALILAQLLAEVAVPHLAMVLAVDFVGWIDVLAATLIVTRLAPGWRAMKALASRVVQASVHARPRTQRARRIRRPAAKPSDDPDPVWGLAFA